MSGALALNISLLLPFPVPASALVQSPSEIYRQLFGFSGKQTALLSASFPAAAVFNKKSSDEPTAH